MSVLSLRDAPALDVLRRLSARPPGRSFPERRLLEIELLRRAAEAPPGYDGALCRWAVSDDPPELRARAAAGCIASGEPDPGIADRLGSDPHWAVRARTATALADKISSGVREPEHVALLQRLADDPHPTVRNAARARKSVARPWPPARSEPQQGTNP